MSTSRFHRLRGSWRSRLAAIVFSIGAGAALAAAPATAPQSLTLTGTVTNTTHLATAPATFELIFDGDKITGWLTTAAPLDAGRWPIEGLRQGAWVEVNCSQAKDTRTQFRGVLSPTEFRGTYLFGGKGLLIQYGKFSAKVSPK